MRIPQRSWALLLQIPVRIVGSRRKIKQEMAGWKMKFLLLQQDLVDRRKVRSARRTQKKSNRRSLDLKEGREEGRSGFSSFQE